MGYFDWPRCFLIGALQAWVFLDGAAAYRNPDHVHSFVTQPELRAPKWNVSIYDQQHLSPGYIFVAPYERIGQTDPGQGWIGPHIYDQDGDLIWSGAHLFSNMSVQDFRVSRVNGKDRMSLIRPELRAGIVLDEHFNVDQDIPIEGFNMHDFNFIDDGKRALLILRGVMNSSREDAIATGLEEGLCQANFHGIAEYDVQTWEPTWEWSSNGHIWLNESTMANGPAINRCHGEWDYMHANAVDKCPDGDILLSGRHTDAIYKISRETGEIVWRLGGKANDFELEEGLNFTRQHDVRCRAQNETTTIITLLDNAKGEDPRKPSSDFSRGLRIALNNETMQATLLEHFDHPYGPGSYAFRRGTYQQLPNDHVIMGWSEHGHLSEHMPDGRMVMQMVMQPFWVGTYRSYKFPFVGAPLDPPDVYSEAFDGPDNTTNTIVYVSWNGATEVAQWRLSKSAKHGAGAIHLATEERTGFETALAYEGFARYVSIEAINRDGKIIGRSKTVATIPPPNLLGPAIASEQSWLDNIVDDDSDAADFDFFGGNDKDPEDLDGHPSEADTAPYQPATPDAPSILADISEREGAAFASGFVIALLFVSLGLGVWFCATRKTGLKISSPRFRIPWYRQQVYQPLNTESKTSSRTHFSDA